MKELKAVAIKPKTFLSYRTIVLLLGDTLIEPQFSALTSKIHEARKPRESM